MGGNIFVVINYEDAINELCRKEKGKCPYYCVWIFSGNNKCHLPDEDSDPNLLDQFMDLLHIYSKSGGSLILFGESEPLFFQANLFLEKHEFPKVNEDNLPIHTNLRLSGNHLGKKNLTPQSFEKFKKLEIFQKFNSNKKITYLGSKKNRKIIQKYKGLVLDLI